MFLLAPRHLHPPEYADQAPDIAIEILSPSSSITDTVDKVNFYLRHGVRSVWLVDPERRRVDIHKQEQPMRRIEGSAILTDQLLPGFELPLQDLFAA